MGLLQEIESSAVDANIDLAVVLRKAKILAARLGHEAFKQRVDQELNGYTSTDTLPAYRVLRKVESRGDFVGSFGSALKNAPIPSLCVPKQFREFVMTVRLTQGVAYYESLVKAVAQDTPRIN